MKGSARKGRTAPQQKVPMRKKSRVPREHLSLTSRDLDTTPVEIKAQSHRTKDDLRSSRNKVYILGVACCASVRKTFSSDRAAECIQAGLQSSLVYAIQCNVHVAAIGDEEQV